MTKLKNILLILMVCQFSFNYIYPNSKEEKSIDQIELGNHQKLVKKTSSLKSFLTKLSCKIKEKCSCNTKQDKNHKSKCEVRMTNSLTERVDALLIEINTKGEQFLNDSEKESSTIQKKTKVNFRRYKSINKYTSRKC